MNSENTRRAAYQAYLLRLWHNDGEASWRASLQSTATEQFYHFADVEALFVFLLAQLSLDAEQADETSAQQSLRDVWEEHVKDELNTDKQG